MVLNSKATKWLIITVIVDIILYICWFSTDHVAFEVIAVLGSLSLPIIPFVIMSKEEQKQGLEKYQKAMEVENEKKLTQGYKCPNCGMMAGHKISAVSKTVSVGILGLASDKIGKNYKCNNCGYEW